MKEQPIVLYAADSTHKGTQIGPETITRCNAVIEFIKKSKCSHFTIYLGAGVNPHFKKNTRPLSLLMRRYIIAVFEPLRLGKSITIKMSGDLRAWGTLAETNAIMRMLQQDDEKRVIIFSSWYHLPRISFIWWMYRGFSYQHKSIDYTDNLRVLREVGAWIKLLFQIPMSSHLIRS